MIQTSQCINYVGSAQMRFFV